MSCKRWEQSIFLHAHGQLTGPKRVLVESHIQSCGTCRTRWARWVVERDQLRRNLAPLPQAGWEMHRSVDSVGARIRAEGRTGTPSGTPRQAAAAGPRRGLVLVCAAILLGVALSAAAALWDPLMGERGLLTFGKSQDAGIARPLGILCPPGGPLTGPRVPHAPRAPRAPGLGIPMVPRGTVGPPPAAPTPNPGGPCPGRPDCPENGLLSPGTSPGRTPAGGLR
jgi:hypothetical protein